MGTLHGGVGGVVLWIRAGRTIEDVDTADDQSRAVPRHADLPATDRGSTGPQRTGDDDGAEPMSGDVDDSAGQFHGVAVGVAGGSGGVVGQLY